MFLVFFGVFLYSKGEQEIDVFSGDWDLSLDLLCGITFKMIGIVLEEHHLHFKIFVVMLKTHA